jgi:hypothetical protein
MTRKNKFEKKRRKEDAIYRGANNLELIQYNSVGKHWISKTKSEPGKKHKMSARQRQTHTPTLTLTHTHTSTHTRHRALNVEGRDESLYPEMRSERKVSTRKKTKKDGKKGDMCCAEC